MVERHNRAVIAVSEGIRDDKGEYWTSRISQDIEQDSYGHVQLSGSGSLADFLAGTLRSNLPHGPWRIRADTFGYLQRSFPATISPTDSWEARLVGQMAVIYSLEDIDAGSVVLTISLDQVGVLDVAVQVDTADGEAIAPGDYTAVVAQTATIAAGSTSTTVMVTVYEPASS